METIQIQEYKKVCTEISEFVIKPCNSIWLHIDLNEELTESYIDIFQFCQKQLLAADSYFAYAKFYFYDSMYVNAAAIQSKDKYFIAISKAYVRCFVDIFKNAQSIFRNSSNLKKYTQPNPFENKIDRYMFSQVYRFTFFHEFAHLLQYKFKNKSGINFAEENFENEDILKFDQEQHARELDADAFAMKYMANALAIECTDTPFRISNKFIFERLCVFLSSILIYFFRLHNNFGKFYTFEGSHPHPLTRISYVIPKFLEFFNEDTSFEYSFDINLVTAEVYNICIEVVRFDHNEMLKQVSKYEPKIVDYISTMNEKHKQYSYMVFNNQQ